MPGLWFFQWYDWYPPLLAGTASTLASKCLLIVPVPLPPYKYMVHDSVHVGLLAINISSHLCVLSSVQNEVCRFTTTSSGMGSLLM